MAKWDKILSRGNVEDRRSAAPLVGGLTVGGVVVLLAVNFLMGGDLSTFLQDLNQYSGDQPYTSEQNIDTSYKDYASTVLGSDNDVWKEKLHEKGINYIEPKLVLFRNYTDSECGGADSRVGPHYCPVDQTIYLDETFFDVLTSRLNARGGDVAQAYVISHEVGHHVQNLLGTLDERNNAGSEEEQNALSVKTELQADCFAGIWANSLNKESVFEPGEISEAMDAAAAVGDDRIQQVTEGYVNPETWTHGSSQQRLNWFMKGYNTGSIDECNTFS
jgi:predicted metalloprotease